MVPHIPYAPRKWAIGFHQSFKRFAALVLHRRAGKTVATLLQHQRAATDDAWERRRLKYLSPTVSGSQLDDLLRQRVYGHILPTRVQAKLIAWDKLKYYSEPVNGVPNESELRIDYPGGHRIQLFGGDEPDKLRGPAFSGVSFDEYGLHPPNIFSEVISKNLADHLGYAVFLGTIKGKNQLYKTYEAARQSPEEWFSLWQDISRSLKTEEDASTLMLRQAMVDDQKLIQIGLMSQEEYDQEWFLSTEAAIKGAYYGTLLAAARRDGRLRRVPHDPSLPVHDVWDLGAGPNLAVGLFQRVSREVHMIEYLEGTEQEGITQMIAELKRRPYVYGKHFAPHDIKATELTTGKTREETAKKLGWPFTMVPDIGVDDGINAGKLMFPRMWIDEKGCEKFVEAIAFYRRVWHERQGVFGDHPVHDWASHPADMYRYAAVAEDQMTNDKVKPRLAGSVSGGSARGADGLGWMG